MGLKIQCGGQNVILFVLSCHCSKICQKDCPHQNIFKLTLSQKSFYVFRKDRQCKFIFLLSPSLDLINIISVQALEAMKVAKWNLAEKLVYFAGCRLLSTTLSPYSSLYISCDTDCTIFILSQDENYCFWSKMSPKPFILTPCHPEQGAITSQLNSQLLIQNKSPFCKKQTKKSSFLWKFNPFKQKLCLKSIMSIKCTKESLPRLPKNQHKFTYIDTEHLSASSVAKQQQHSFKSS